MLIARWNRFVDAPAMFDDAWIKSQGRHFDVKTPKFTTIYILKQLRIQLYRLVRLRRLRRLPLLEVLYKSSNYLALSKPPWFHMHPDSDKPQCHFPVLPEVLSYQFPELIDPTTKLGWRNVHRLDLATSGTLVYALNREAAAALSYEFRRGRIRKDYLALVYGTVQLMDSTINSAIGLRHPDATLYNTVEDGGVVAPKTCSTGVQVLAYGTFKGAEATKLLLRLYTGRTHQLRVHTESIGHPIIGDQLYLGVNRRLKYLPATDHRMMLHAYRLRADTPNETLDLRSKDPFEPEAIPDWHCTTSIQSIEEADSNEFDLRNSRQTERCDFANHGFNNGPPPSRVEDILSGRRFVLKPSDYRY